MANYKCTKSKEEIVNTIAEHFFIANEAYEEVHDDTRWGVYNSLAALVHELGITEEDD